MENINRFVKYLNTPGSGLTAGMMNEIMKNRKTGGKEASTILGNEIPYLLGSRTAYGAATVSIERGTNDARSHLTVRYQHEDYLAEIVGAANSFTRAMIFLRLNDARSESEDARDVTRVILSLLQKQYRITHGENITDVPLQALIFSALVSDGICKN